MTQNIMLAGGLTLIPGFKERLETEMERLNPAVKPRVLASPYRYLFRLVAPPLKSSKNKKKTFFPDTTQHIWALALRLPRQTLDKR